MKSLRSEITNPKLGFLGTGFAKKVQIPAFLMAGGCEVVSVASARIENAEATAKEFGVSHFTADWRETVDHPDVDLVCVTTPPNLHCEQVLYAAERGKHILCEKPMAMNVAEAELMCSAAKEANILALIDHELRFQVGRQKAREMLRGGEIGKIRHVKYSFRNAMRGDAGVPWNWWSDEAAGGGTLGAIGSHAIDSLHWFLDTDLASVSCQLQTHVRQRTDSAGNVRSVTTDDEALLNFRFADSELTDDTTGTMSLSMIEYPEYEHSVEFVGSKGSLKVLFLGEFLLTRAGESDWKKVDIKVGESVHGLFDSGFPNGFVAFAPKIIEALRTGSTTVDGAATFEDGLRVQRVIDAARESDRLGKVISL